MKITEIDDDLERELARILVELGRFQVSQQMDYDDIKDDLKYGLMAMEWLESYNALREMNEG